MPSKLITFLFILSWFLFSCEKEDPGTGTLNLLQVFSGDVEIDLLADITKDIPVDRPITLVFSIPLDKNSAAAHISLKHEEDIIKTDFGFSSQNKTVVVYPSGPLSNSTTYTLSISGQLKGAGGESFSSREISFRTVAGKLEILSIDISGTDASGGGNLLDVPVDLSIDINFSVPVDQESLESAVQLTGSGTSGLQSVFSNENKTVNISGSGPLKYTTKYIFSIKNTLKGTDGESFAGYSKTFYTQFDETPKFPVISDEELLTKVQQQTFRYFWDFAHPGSGLARERNSSGDIVTIGGSGFGVMAILVGIERGFIGRTEGIERLTKIVDFLAQADRFHGAWPHWMNGNTGAVIPFGTKDNGGDLVETAFMVQGLLAVRAYLDENDPGEKALIDKITTLWEEVEWSWYTRGGQNVLYWHWSPEYNWEMNHPIRGYNEALIVYVLAAASPTYPVTQEVYEEGWAQNGGIVNGNSFYGIDLPLGYDYGGPLFFAHYSFMGLDPRNLSDQYADYWVQNVNHSLINQAYCVANPKKYVGYSEDCWGLTASDNHQGYSAHSPTNDLGVITPTAALSSFPYTPEASMKALKFFYYVAGDKLWGEYGFYDAFNVTENWTANSYLAIDQGPIVVMIENHRSGLLWDIFMTDPDVKKGLNSLNFNY